jgi:CBS domain-containing protein
MPMRESRNLYRRQEKRRISMTLASITAKDIMATKVVTLEPDMDVMDAMHTLARHRISGAPVVNARGTVVGMLTERDCIRKVLVASYHGELSCGAVAECMSQDVQTVDAGTSLLNIAESFVNTKYRRYPVIHENRLIGIISRQDVLRAALELA